MINRFKKKIIISEKGRIKSSGMVVDLKKENHAPYEVCFDKEPDSQGITENKRWFFPKKKKEIDLLNKFQIENEDFGKLDCLSGFDDEKTKNKKQFLFFDMLVRTLSIWWIPFFVIKFIFLLFWRVLLLIIFRRRVWDDKIKVKIIKDEDKGTLKIGERSRVLIKKEVPSSINNKAEISNKKNKKVKKARQSFDFDKFLLKIRDFLLGNKVNDYLYQQVLFEEITKKRLSPMRHFIVFLLLASFLTVPFKVFSERSSLNFDTLKSEVMDKSKEAGGNVKQAASAISDLELGDAGYSFFLARDNFKQARESLEEINNVLFVLAKFVPNDKIKMASESKNILKAGEIAANLGRNLSLALGNFSKIEEGRVSNAIDEFIIYEKGALEDAHKLKNQLEKINTKSIPKKYREEFLLIKNKIDDLLVVLEEVSDIAEKINIFLGKEIDKRYLFVFQNNNEMRATGGFIGSYALVDFSEGKIKNIEIPQGGSYDTEGGLERFVVAPEPMYLVNPLWHFWDANWWPDWEKSAKKLMWFYEKSGGPTVDGVISFTPTVLEEFLKIIGPVDMRDEYGVIMDADNFWENIREIIEKENKTSALSHEDTQKKPKKVIGDLLAKILEELPNRIDKKSFIKLLGSLDSIMSQKQVLFYFNDEQMQAEMEERNWAGKMKKTSNDYLAVINTNIAGGKSDKKIRENIIHKAEIMPDGSIINSVRIEREHIGEIDEPFYGVRNVNWMRVYVPLGSKLIHASGFRGPNPVYFEYPEDDWERDIELIEEEEKNSIIDKDNMHTKVYDEDGKTVFANWSMIDPGQKVVIELKYELGFKIEKPKQQIKEENNFFVEIINKFFKKEQKDLYPYSLMIQKQAGSRFTKISSKLEVADNFKSIWNYSKNTEEIDDSWNIDEDLNQDKYLAVILEKTNE